MSTYVDLKYLNLISLRLERFSKKGDYLFNFRCPFCGDSRKNKSKARGYAYRKKNDMFYRCHNCSMGTNLSNLIKHVDPQLHKEYVMERFKESDTPRRTRNFNPPTVVLKTPNFNDRKFTKGLKSFDEIGLDHPAYKFIENRQIPQKYVSDIYLVNKFFTWTNTLVPNKFKSIVGDHPRMIIPFRDENGEVFAYQGRAFGNEKPKYITIILDHEKDKLFGLNNLDKESDVLVVEGPIDSMFLDNSVAVAQSDLRIPELKDKSILVPDNEPRNKEIVKQIQKSIDVGYRVVIWPDYVRQKDINDMILSGITSEEVIDIIKNNTYSGLQAKVQFQNWKKI